eukprot:6198561-Pleurochrysis_carterae.AAC.1
MAVVRGAAATCSISFARKSSTPSRSTSKCCRKQTQAASRREQAYEMLQPHSTCIGAKKRGLVDVCCSDHNNPRQATHSTATAYTGSSTIGRVCVRVLCECDHFDAGRRDQTSIVHTRAVLSSAPLTTYMPSVVYPSAMQSTASRWPVSTLTHWPSRASHSLSSRETEHDRSIGVSRLHAISTTLAGCMQT